MNLTRLSLLLSIGTLLLIASFGGATTMSGCDWIEEAEPDSWDTTQVGDGCPDGPPI
jgi:hypothetical protein